MKPFPSSAPTRRSDDHFRRRCRGAADAGGSPRSFAYFGRLDDRTRRLREILGSPADVIAEPIRKNRLRESIRREATLAF
jgi:hypothetical protein